MSENLNKLYTIIQINGELDKSTKITDLKLSERELFIDNKSNLYYGSLSGDPVQVNANKANEAQKANNLGSSDSTFNFNNDTKTGKIGKLTIDNDKDKLNGNNEITINKVILDESTVTNSELQNIKKLVLADNMWGIELPTNNLFHGQIFFKVSDQKGE